MLTGEKVKDLKKSKGSYLLVTDQGHQVSVDGVIAGIGITPNVELARSGGLKIGNGILVDEMLRTNNLDIYAAGDVAEFSQLTLGKRVRVQHCEDNANTMGRQAGRNMAGASEPYHHLSYFYSDLFELGYEAVGELDPRLETFVDWKEPFKKRCDLLFSRWEGTRCAVMERLEHCAGSARPDCRARSVQDG